MNKALFPLLMLVMLLGTGASAVAEVRDGEVTFSPFLGSYVFDGSQQLEPSVAAGVRLGYNLGKNLGVEGQFTYAQPRVNGEYGNLNVISGDLLYHFMPEGKFVPYILAGGGWMDTRAVDRSSQNGTVDYGAGIKMFLDELVSLRLDVRQIMSLNPNNDNSVGYWQNSLFSIGLSFQFGFKSAAAHPVPVAVDGPLIWMAENKKVPAGKILITGLKQEQNFLEILASERITNYKVTTLSQPSRLVVEIANAVHGFNADSIAINRLGITTARFESIPGYLRIILDAEQGRLIPYRVEETEKGLKIIVTSP